MSKINTEDIAKTMVRALQKTMNEDFDKEVAPNFITTTVVDTETGEKFEFTVRRHEGMTPEEKLKELQKELDECKELRS